MGTRSAGRPGGFLGVEVFFVVSGYLITSLLLERAARDGSGLAARRSTCAAPAACCPRSSRCSRSSSRTRCCSCPTRSARCAPTSLAALTYTSNWWQIIAHRSYIAEAGRPELLKHLWSLAIEEQYYLAWPFLLDARAAQARPPTHARHDARHRARRRRSCSRCSRTAASTTRTTRPTRGSPASSSAPRSRSRSRRIASAACPAAGARRARHRRARSGCSCCSPSFGVLHHFGINGFSFPTSTHDNLAVFHGGFLLVDLATLLVIAAAVHPSSDVGRALGWKTAAVDRAALVQPLSLALPDLLHHPARPRHPPARHLVPLVPLRGLARVRHPPRAFLRGRRALVPVRRDADPQRRDRPLPRDRARRGRRTPPTPRAARRGHRRLAQRSPRSMLGTGLATAATARRRRSRASTATGPENGANLDPSALQALQGTTTTTVHDAEDHAAIDRDHGEKPPKSTTTTLAARPAHARARHRRLRHAGREGESRRDDPGHGRRRDQEPPVRQAVTSCSTTSRTAALPSDGRHPPRHERPHHQRPLRPDHAARSARATPCTSSPRASRGSGRARST